jgi:ATP-dependent Clp protease ATP-binding subunit ClpC
MQGYNFTERVRKVLAQARDEAVALGHSYVGCEHILLGLLDDDGVASVVLQNLGLDLSHATTVLKQALKPGDVAARANTRDLPYTSRSKRVIELSMSEARELQHSYVGTEHLLLGILREGKGIAVEILLSFGITLEKARAETLRILGVDIATLTPPTGEKPNLIHVSLRYSNGAVVTANFMDTADAARFLTSR